MPADTIDETAKSAPFWPQKAERTMAERAFRRYPFHPRTVGQALFCARKDQTRYWAEGEAPVFEAIAVTGVHIAWTRGYSILHDEAAVPQNWMLKLKAWSSASYHSDDTIKAVKWMHTYWVDKRDYSPELKSLLDREWHWNEVEEHFTTLARQQVPVFATPEPEPPPVKLRADGTPAKIAAPWTPPPWYRKEVWDSLSPFTQQRMRTDRGDYGKACAEFMAQGREDEIEPEDAFDWHEVFYRLYDRDVARKHGQGV